MLFSDVTREHILYKPVADPGSLRGGCANPKGGRQPTICLIFPENCMKMKKFWPRGGGARPLRPPQIHHCKLLVFGKSFKLFVQRSRIISAILLPNVRFWLYLSSQGNPEIPCDTLTSWKKTHPNPRITVYAVSRCRTRGESEDQYRRESMQARDPPWL